MKELTICPVHIDGKRERDIENAPPERKAKVQVNVKVNVKICWALGVEWS